ncbi:hypothetical protein Trydic_g2560 [Trypoxylus dichotomus]
MSHLSRWQLIERLNQHFWQRWSREYLEQLQRRTKWSKEFGENLCVGQLVLVREDNVPSLAWSMGRITAVCPGKDGIARVAVIKTSRSEVKRPANRLCVLPINIVE